MDNSFIAEVLKYSNMMNVEQGMNIYHLLSQVLAQDIPGEIVELGCYEGITGVLIQKTLDQANSKKELHLFDSFEGLPKVLPEDGLTTAKEGMLRTAKDSVIANFNRFNLKQPTIFEGWFKDTLPTNLPDKICFAHLDGDMYSSIIESLNYIYPKLSKGAIVIIDDYYCREGHMKIEKRMNENSYQQFRNIITEVKDILPGVKKACDEFFEDKPEKIIVLMAGCERHAYFKKM